MPVQQLMDMENNGSQTTSLTQQLVKLIQEKKIINEDLQACTYFVLDALVNAIVGARTDTGKVIMQWWNEQKTPDAGRQAFLTGALVHTLEMDDLHKQSVTHPGCVVVPAAMAIAAREGHTGKQLLKSILYGYEAMCRTGNAVGRSHYKIWHSTATCGPFGSAMAVGHLLGLSREQHVWALGNAGTQSSGLWEFMNSGGMSKHLHAGRAAESGVLAAELAKFGFTGPLEILEGKQGLFNAACPDPSLTEIIASPDDPWHLTQTSIKPWPCCRHTHPAIDAVLTIYKDMNKPVKEIIVRTYQAALDVCDRPEPANEYEAKFSLQHCVSAALEEGIIEFDSFNAQTREKFKDTRRKIRVERSPEIDSAYPGNWGCEVEVFMADNQSVKSSRLHCKGDPELPLSPAEMEEKARLLLDYAGINEDEQRRLISYILDLQNQPQVHGLTALLDLDF